MHIYIRGYDENGEKVDMAEDDIIHYIDNTWTEGDIDSIRMGAEDPG